MIHYSYPHMCRDEHQQIGHSDSEHERCPLCRANDKVAALEAKLAALEWTEITPESLPKVGDEALSIYVSYSGICYKMVQSITPLMCVDFPSCKGAGWVFYRAINCPEHPRADCEGCGDLSCPCNILTTPPSRGSEEAE